MGTSNKAAIIVPPIQGIACGGGGGYRPEGAFFDGANDYGTRGTPVGVTDGPLGTFSCWINIPSGATTADKNLLTFWDGANERGKIEVDTDFTLLFRDSAGVQKIQLGTSNLANDTWYHILCSWSSAAVSQSHAYVNDVQDTDVRQGASGNIDYTAPSWAVGAHADGGNTDRWHGCMVDFWFTPGLFLDLTVEANRRKFISASGKPVNLGSDGSAPTGNPPVIYLPGGPSSFMTNQGTGGDFTLTGTLTECPTNPAD